MRTSVLLASLSAFLVIGSGTARASEYGDDVPVPPAEVRGPWYGGTVLMFDAAMIATGVGCVALTDSEGCQLPLYGYLLGGPIIHGRHHGWGRAFGSVGLRVGLPLAGFLFGVGTAGGGLSAIGPSLVGAGVGAVAAIAIDGAWAFDDAPPSTSAAPPPLAFSPAFSFGRGSGTVGLQGRF
jgi:hypothetical protein